MKTKIYNKISTSILTILALILFGATTITAAPGDLDTTFGSGGIVTTPITNYSDRPSSIQVQPDGKIIVSGYSYFDDGGGFGDYVVAGFIARYNSSGTLDTSFGTNGKIVIDGIEYVGISTALQTDGKIVVIGDNYNHGGSPLFAVFRYNPNGTLDASFGTGGKVFTGFGSIYDYSRDVVLQPDGKIVVMGTVGVSGNTFHFGIVRYNPDGSLDPSFGTGGKVITPIGNIDNQASSMLLQPDGKIVLVGNRARDIILVRYNSNGSLDSSFGTNGKAIRPTSSDYDRVNDSVLQSDGKIVVAGYENFGFDSNPQTLIVRFNANGSVDTSFADNGTFRTENGFFVGNGIALQPDGKIVGFGNGVLSPGAMRGFAVARVHPNGSPDTSFGTNGRQLTTIGTNANYGFAVALQADGKILGGGGRRDGMFATDAAIVRYNGDSSVTQRANFDFDGDGKSDISVFRPSDRIWYLNQSTNGFSATQFGLSTDKITPADFDGDGKTDIAVYRDGIWYWLNSSNNNFNAFQFGLANDIPQPADFDGDGRAELAVYRGGNWYTWNLQNNQFNAVQFGIATDKPVVADYDGDGRADCAVFRPSNGVWYLQRSSAGFTAFQFGLSTDKPTQADYDGDGLTDIAVYRPSDGNWYLQRSATGFGVINFGISEDIPSPGDYDGDGKSDVAVFRPSTGVWWLLQSTNGLTAAQFGLNGDVPVPAGYLP